MNSLEKPQKMALLGLAALTLIWSYNWVVMKSALQYMGAFEFSALRCTLGSILLLVVLRLRGQSLKPTPFIPTAIVGILQMGGMVGFSQWALVSGGAGKVAVLAYTMPFWIILLAALVLGEKIRGFQYVVVSIAAAGVILILQPWNLTGSWQSSILAVMSGLCWAASAVAAKRVYAKYPTVDLLSLTAWQMVIGTFVIIFIAFCVDEKPAVWSGYIFYALAYNSILATALGWALWLFLLKNLPAGIAGLSTLAIPVCGILFAWALLGEVPSQVEAVGIGLIILALALISIPNRAAQKQG